MKVRPIDGVLAPQLPTKLSFLVTKACRYKVAHGGRGGAKSWNFARVLLTMAAVMPLRILCARELQVSIAESVHQLLENQIDELGLTPYYDVQKTTITSTCGSEFIFAGLRNNITKIKSMEGIDIVWVEEAEKVSERSWEVLIPTIRKPGSQIWVSFNPDDETDATYKRFVLNPPPDAEVVEINWRDNPWFPPELERERAYLQRVDPDAYAHVWEGKTRKHGKSKVLHGKWVEEWFEPGPEWQGPFIGADWGFSQDPTVIVKCWINDRKLYVEHESWDVGVELDDLNQLFAGGPSKYDPTTQWPGIPGVRGHTIRADNARPETISYLNNHGWGNVVGVEKWAGSVEDGIAFLRAFEQIIVHPRCRHTLEECKLYSFKVDDKTGEILPVIVDKHNHCIDAIRYALQPIIRRQGLGFFLLVEEQYAASKAGPPAPAPDHVTQHDLRGPVAAIAELNQ